MENIPEAIQGALNALAEGLNTTTEFLWPIFVRQMSIEGYGSLIVLLLGALVAYIVAINLKKTYKWFSETAPRQSGYGSDNDLGETQKRPNFESFQGTMFIVHIIISILVTAGTIIGTLNNLKTTIAKIINPEYYALQSLIASIEKMLP